MKDAASNGLSMKGQFAGFKPGEGKMLIVLFSHRDTEPGKFSQFKAVGGELPFPVLFLNCIHGSWYCEGIPRFGDTPQAAATALRQYISELGFERFMCMGFSMGGFGSLLYGSLMDADLIASFSPEAVLNFFDNRSAEQRVGKTSPTDSLLDMLTARQRPTHVFVGTDDMCDVLQASLIAHRTPATVHSLPGITHGTLARLRDVNRLTPLLTELVLHGTTTAIADLEGPVPPPVCLDYVPPAPLQRAAVMAAYCAIYAQTSRPSQAYYIGRRYLADGNWRVAADYLQQAAAGVPEDEDIQQYLKRALRHLRREERQAAAGG